MLTVCYVKTIGHGIFLEERTVVIVSIDRQEIILYAQTSQIIRYITTYATRTERDFSDIRGMAYYGIY